MKPNGDESNIETEPVDDTTGARKKRKKVNVMPAHLAADDDDAQEEF